jgi:hypothetical protein
MNKSYSIISLHKSVILETLKILHPVPSLNTSVLNRFMKGLYEYI